MDSIYWPSETSASPTLEGQLTPQAERDYSGEVPYQLAMNMGQGRTQEALGWGQGAPQPGNAFGANDYVGVLGDFQAAGIAAQEQNSSPAFNSLTFNSKKGTVTAEMPQSTLEDVMAQMNDLKTMKSAAMARVAQLRQQEASGSPILDALSQFAGGMAANDPTMPGWVRALGGIAGFARSADEAAALISTR